MKNRKRKTLNPFRTKGELLDRLDKAFNEIDDSLHRYGKLHYRYYDYEYMEYMSAPVIISDFKRIKTYLRQFKNTVFFSEFIYSLGRLKTKTKIINKDLIKNNEIEEYSKEIVRWKKSIEKGGGSAEYKKFNSEMKDYSINDYLIEFINRYIKFCLNYNFQELVNYQEKINLEVFKDLTSKKKREKVLTQWLSLIQSQIEFDNGKNILFDNYDKHLYSNDIYLISLTDKKEIFQNELENFANKEKLKSPVEETSSENKNFSFQNNKSIEYNLKKLAFAPVISPEEKLLKLHYPSLSINKAVDYLFELKNDVLSSILIKITDLGENEKLVYLKTLINRVELALEFLKEFTNRSKDSDIICSDKAISILNWSIKANNELLKTLNDLTIENKHINEVKPEQKHQISVDNPYKHIFKNSSAFKIFERLHNEYKEEDYLLANYSFVYRMMYQDKLILSHFKPEMFRDWISKEPYSILIDKIKTLNNCATKAKKLNYIMIKDLFPTK